MHKEIVVIGASAGGIEALKKLIPDLPRNFPAPILTVVHLAQRVSFLPDILTKEGGLPAAHAKEGEKLHAGRIYIAPPTMHMLLNDDHISLTRGPKENGFRPSINVLFRSAAHAYRDRVIGVILTGALDDGTHGLLTIKKYGGTTIVQDPEEADFPDMPLSALRYVRNDYTLKIPEMAARLIQLTNDGSKHRAGDRKGRKAVAWDEDINAKEKVKIEKPPIPVVCPECGGNLWVMQEGDLPQFQCRVGHVYSLDALVEEHSEALERALWTAFRIMEEHAQFLRRVQSHSGNKKMTERVSEKAKAMEEDAAVIYSLLTRRKE